MTTIIITCISVYVLSAFFMWLYNYKAHSKGGIYVDYNTKAIDVFITLCPILNTIMAVNDWSCNFPYKIKKKNFNKFFNIKK